MFILEFIADVLENPKCLAVFFGGGLFLCAFVKILLNINTLRRIKNAEMCSAKVVGKTHPRGNHRITNITYDVDIGSEKSSRLTLSAQTRWLDDPGCVVRDNIKVAYDRANKRLFPHGPTLISETIGMVGIAVIGALLFCAAFV